MIVTKSICLDFRGIFGVEAVTVVVVAASVGAAAAAGCAVVVVVGAISVVVTLFLSLSSPDCVDVGLVGVEGSREGGRRRRDVGVSVGVEGTGAPPSNRVDASRGG